MPVPEEGEVSIGNLGLKTLEASDNLFLTTDQGVSGRAKVGDLVGFLSADIANVLPQAEEILEQVATNTGIAVQAKTDAQTLKDQTAAIRDEVVIAVAHKGDTWWLATKADLLTFITTPDLNYCDIRVLADESYGGGLGVYIWNKITLTQILSF